MGPTQLHSLEVLLFLNLSVPSLSCGSEPVLSKGNEIGNREGVWGQSGVADLWEEVLPTTSRMEQWDDATSLQGRSMPN